MSAPPPLPVSDLRAPLPPDVMPSMTWGPLRYRKYPVFSLPWLKWRTLLVFGLSAAYASLSAVGYLFMNASAATIFSMMGYFVAGMVLGITGGPAIATWLRHRRFSTPVEVTGIIISVVLGFVIAMAADWWSSMGIARGLGETELTASAVKEGENMFDDARMSLFVIGSIILHWAVSGGVASISYFSERRRLQARALHLASLDSDMRLAVLQAQIEPHFLFNTLASIRPLIRQDAARAESALDALSDHLRATIPQMRSGIARVMSTLGQQVDICASYLTVMQVRMGSRLHHEMHVPRELREKPFPPLMLLSLVENAIKHGLEPKAGPGAIILRASVAGSDLRVSVSDDGQGLKEGISSGLGLSNIREQLMARFGNRARLTVAARPEGGTVADITLPATS